MNSGTSLPITYILPLRSSIPIESAEFRKYIVWLSARVEVIAVDGSPDDVFAAHHQHWGRFIRHVKPHPELVTPMGKVGGVLTGIRLASNERIIVADDDVRYGMISLNAVANALDDADVVRPQNYFSPSPWHALWDSGRIVLNRVTGGDWPGTLGIRKSTIDAAGGYDGGVMFENLELVRTIIAAGGKESLCPSIYVRRLPSSTDHFWSQRVRQAYDELARPSRLAVQLLMLPLLLLLALTGSWAILGLALLSVMGVAEIGRRKDGGTKIFSAVSSFLAPAWVIERAICIWLAVASRVVYGGIRYRGVVLRRAATPLRELRERHAGATQALGINPARPEPRRRLA
jgi:hypothetical protein